MRGANGASSSAPWLIPSLAYVLIVGLLGLTTKLALEDLTWQELVVWTAISYTAIATVLLARGDQRTRLAPGAGFAALSGFCAATALVMLFLALDAGEVSRVVPITSSYPVITLLLAVPILAESVTRSRIAATAMVVTGVTLLSI